MQRFIALITLFCSCGFTAKAQQQPVNLLQKSIQNIKNYRSISFEVMQVDKNMLSTDTTVSKTREAIVQNADGYITAQNLLSLTQAGKLYNREVYTRGKLYSLDLKDSIYTEDTRPNKVTNSLTGYINQVTYLLNKKSGQISRLKDSLIAGKFCYGFFARVYDTIVNNQHNYTYQYIYLNPKTLLPVYLKEQGSGSATKGGYEIGRVNVFNERRFDNYMLNKHVNPSVFVFNRTGFYSETTAMLPQGALAPAVNVQSLTGMSLPATQFKNKVMLLQFGSVTCGANALANPLMNRLSAKYSGRNAAIACIYSEETPVQAQKYIEANNIHFPVYLGSSQLKRKFQTKGTPNFYLVDRQGIIVKSINGYSDGLEQELSKAIDGLLVADTK
jgi:thiol-disulfide isomerase/thioredoxin